MGLKQVRGNRGVEKTTSQGALCSVLLIKYHLGDQTKNTDMGRSCSTYGARKGACRVLVGEPEGKPLGRPSRRLEDNIKLDLLEVRRGTWTGSIWLWVWAGCGCCKCVNEPLGSTKCRELE